MNEELRQQVIERLLRGEDLPPEWARELFPPEKREYELAYYGKKREEEILAETMAVPLQAVSTFGKAEADDWRNMLIFGDNLQVLRRLLEDKREGKLCNADGTPGVRLIYIDPPFATKQEFRGSQDQKAYQDRIAGAEFIEFLRKRLILLRELLSDNGAIFVHLDQKKGHYIKVILDEVLRENNFRNEVVVRRTQKNYIERDYISSLNLATDSIYVYARSERTQFSPVYKDTPVPETWHALDAPNWSGTRPNLIYELFGKLPPAGRCWAWSKERAEEAIKAGDLRPNPRTGKPEYRIPARDKTICTSLWDDMVAYSFSSGYPTEKNEKVLARIVKMSSAPGDLVLDAFVGSGTTLAVAEKLGRRWIGIDCGKLAIYTIQKRMLNLRQKIGNKGKPLPPRPFTVYNAGLYDFSTLRQLPWEDWRRIALQLFECRDEPHTVGGLRLDGKRKGHSVLVFNHHAHPSQRIDEETVRTIHAAVGDKVGRKFFIIAPRAVFAFQQDYIDLGSVRYYALRIPYSVINELHRREFTALQQPNDENAVNDIVEAWGFDFIRPPEVIWQTGVTPPSAPLIPEAKLKITGFKSHARLRKEDVYGGLETFSMLLLDFDYNSEVFELDRVFYARDLAAQDWEARFPLESLGENVMAVFMDIHGNEAREVIPRARFSQL